MRKTHGHTVGGRPSPTYSSWAGMMDRCHNPRAAAYRFYGERGIRVCRRWHKFVNFLADMGVKPYHWGMIGRINHRKSYARSNCRREPWTLWVPEPFEPLDKEKLREACARTVQRLGGLRG